MHYVCAGIFIILYQAILYMNINYYWSITERNLLLA